MVIALLVFLFVGLIVAVTPGAVLGYAFVALSGRLSLRVRLPLLLVLAAGSAALWLGVIGAVKFWGAAVIVVSFTATLVSGAVFLLREAQRRRAPRYPAVVWPGWQPPADSR
ncbi:hypothetical protein AB0B01_10725 [Streptomyces sp. NPDC044571]|uniref:hypothetical protein n=1 Tax=Streptomyces sp. NPDC044571 TaxID=3155371 RepID=UPI00340E4C52